MAINIVLVEPEIPQNTGNIARTCAATGCVLHLVEPLGFLIDEKHVRRAGLDYWHLLDLKTYSSIDEYFEKNKDARKFFLSTKSELNHSDAQFEDGDHLLFGKETRGLSEELLAQNYDMCLRIPMAPAARSLNLSNAVAIVAYEALRQLYYPQLSLKGKLTSVETI